MFFSILSQWVGIKDLVDVLLVATLLYYIYRTMRDSGALSVFAGVLAFVLAWAVAYKIFDMVLIGTIMDKFIDIGIFILVILFQDQIRRFLSELGSQRGWGIIGKFFKHRTGDDDVHSWILPVVNACSRMSKSKTGALIVVQQQSLLDDYVYTGDIIDAAINSRLIENIFFKNSPLHDGAMIIADGVVRAVGCILPVYHDKFPSHLGLRHRAAMGVTQNSDAIAIVVSEETGNISYFYKGEYHLRLAKVADLEDALSKIVQPTNEETL